MFEALFSGLKIPPIENDRKTMSEVNWARAGLGMKLLEERVERRPEFSKQGTVGSRDQDWNNKTNCKEGGYLACLV